jgi:hypothetical protein
MLTTKQREDWADALIAANRIGRRTVPFSKMGRSERVHAILHWIVSIVVSIPVGLMCGRTAAFAQGTEEALREFWTSLENSDPPRFSYSRYPPVLLALAVLRTRLRRGSRE